MGLPYTALNVQKVGPFEIMRCFLRENEIVFQLGTDMGFPVIVFL